MDSKMDMRVRIFPDELVEKIISMMPFPSLFKARVLSKAWCSKVAPVVDGNACASSFQGQVISCLSKWLSYCPALLNGDRFIAYDRDLRRWRKMKLLSYLPENFSRLQVILFSESQNPGPNQYTYDAQIYNSRLDTWTCTNLTTDDSVCLSPPSRYLDGTLYLVTTNSSRSQQIVILAFNVKDSTFSRHSLSFYLDAPSASVSLVICGGDVLAVMSRASPPIEEILALRGDSDGFITPKQSILVTKFVSSSGKLAEVARGPPETVDHAVSNHPISDGTQIYFGGRASSPVLTYNVQNEEWGLLPAALGSDEDVCELFGSIWNAFNFQPGLNPFMVV
ncbi:hypothetical protein AXG93_3348s1070 [Marchantia polymorpha subsp. ruderalis]|uniref:Uncharacterized protein n=1 Tax=Marchantia polymorpha subsp. ruderalis TaxID=1480154 RepID=A0A176VNC8_MARPO|nr:hypothetical protein AXG93_3348s1070 [Marchantia polymorpha subsp. ruderalis]